MIEAIPKRTKNIETMYNPIANNPVGMIPIRTIGSERNK
jgi:hypothetical protein